MIFKIVPVQEWAAAEARGLYEGSAKDRADGFLHFSTASQVMGTLERYYADVPDLLLVAMDEARLSAALRYESSRDGEMFPHLYGTVSPDSAAWVKTIKRDARNGFVLPALL